MELLGIVSSAAVRVLRTPLRFRGLVTGGRRIQDPLPSVRVGELPRTDVTMMPSCPPPTGAAPGAGAPAGCVPGGSVDGRPRLPAGLVS